MMLSIRAADKSGKLFINILLMFLAAAMLLVAGCGDVPSASDGAGGISATGTSASSLLNGTLAECLSCHSDAANPAGLNVVTGDSDASKANGIGWLAGPHANYETSPTYLGRPEYAAHYFSSSCLVCHDQQGDGRTIDEYAEKSGNTAVGEVERPVIGCAACHGSGDNHFGVGDVEFKEPGAERCGQCHNDDFPHVDRHSKPAGYRIYEDFVNSPHAGSANSHVKDSNGLNLMCAKCHTDEGARQYMNNSVASLMGQYSDMEYGSVECRTCHDAHNPDKLLKDAGTDAFGNATSAQYETCTSCHMKDVASDAQTNANYSECTVCHQGQRSLHGVESDVEWGPQWFPAAAGVGNFDGSKVFYDTHYDLPGTEAIEGYILDPSNPDVCLECHNVHSADITINEQWARSGHGGHILDIKERAFLNTVDKAGDPDAAKANAYNILNGTDQYGAQRDDTWVHMDFKSNTTPPFPSKKPCQRCKTSTGFRNMANDPLGYDADGDGNPDTNNVFFAVGKQKELLYCWACHTSSSGALRDPLDVAGVGFANIIEGQYTHPAGRIANVPDAGGSNICMACHSGRNTGANIQANYTDDNVAEENFGSFSPHYLSAGGTLYRLTGYEFHASGDYDDYSWFAHNRIGIDNPNTGTNGPCVGCHMRSDESHSFEASTRVSGSITNIPAYEQTCLSCHGDKSDLIADMNSLHGGFEAAMDVLQAKLEASMPNLIYNSTYPYFWNSVSDSEYKAWDDLEKVGAAINLSLFHHEKGAYVHNSRYTKRLLFDSIDYLEDGALHPDKELAEDFVGNTTAFEYLNYGFRP